MSDAPPLFVLEAVTRRFAGRGGADVVAVNEATVSISRGAFAVVTGPSGGGKTTLLALLGALDRPTSGRVGFDGRDLLEASDAERSRIRRRIGFVFQSSPMIRRLSVWENVTYPLIPLGTGPRERRERARALLDRVGLARMFDARPEELSGGELQRVGVARALVADPVAVLADEPTSNLDRRSGEAIAELLGGIHAAGVTVVVATHDATLTARATTAFEMDAGRLTVPRS